MGFAANLQTGAKQLSFDLAQLSARAVIASVYGVTLGLVAHEALGPAEGLTLGFMVAFGISAATVWRLTRGWSMVGISIFSLISVLLGLVLRLYVLVAPDL